MENYDAELGQAIKTLQYLPPHVLAQACYEAFESWSAYGHGENTSDTKEAKERYELIIEACFQIESTNSGTAEFLRQVLKLHEADITRAQALMLPKGTKV